MKHVSFDDKNICKENINLSQNQEGVEPNNI